MPCVRVPRLRAGVAACACPGGVAGRVWRRSGLWSTAGGRETPSEPVSPARVRLLRAGRSPAPRAAKTDAHEQVA